MQLIKFLLLISVCVSSFVVTSLHAQSTASVAKVNGVAIPQARLDFMVKAAVAQGQPESSEMRNTLRENLIAEEIIAQEAQKKGLDRDPDVITQTELARQAILVRAYQADYIKNNAVSDDILRREYETVKAQMGDKEYKARHILVESEAEAKDIIASLKKKGASFEKIAKEKSIDTGSKNNGGELGWSAAAAYVKPFADALQNMKKGNITEKPVQTNFGWHVIRLEDVRPAVPPPFEEVKTNMQQRVLQRNFAATVQDLRSKAKVE